MESKATFTKTEIERSLLFIEPGPVVLVTSFDPDKKKLM